MYLLDTDVCSDVMKRRSRALVERVRGFAPRELKVSVVTVYELEFGARRTERRDEVLAVIHAFLDNVEVLLLNRAAARHAGQIRADLTAAGEIIGAYDLLIAGHALSLGATLVTNNVGEFGRVRGLDLENWASGP